MEIKYDENHELVGTVSKQLQENIDLIETLFSDSGDLVRKRFVLERAEGTLAMYLVYIDGLTNNDMVERTILRPLLYEWRETKENPKGNTTIPLKEDIWEEIFDRQMESVDIIQQEGLMDVVGAVLKGDTAIFMDGNGKACILSTKRFPSRSMMPPQKEAGLKGPKDCFIESLRNNTALMRRRIRDPKMKVKQIVVGQRSRTDCALVYHEDFVEKRLLKSVMEKLNAFAIDGIQDSGMLLHLLEEKWYSPFPQLQTTERPDKAASAVLEGRIVLVVDNSPEVIILPSTWNSFFQAADDYYNRFAVGSFARALRYFAAYITVLLPGLYVAITCYYPQVLPTQFLLAIVGARTDITFPIVVEVLIMELLFELLREAGIRLPGPLGNTIGVVGGLIVGQAAVEASLVSTIVVIVVALTAIASFVIPNEEFSSTFRLLKFLMIGLGAIGGLYGIMLGIMALRVHLASLESFGIPYMMPLVSGSIDDDIEYQDYVMRKPIFAMKYRPIYTREGNRRRFRRKNQ